VLVEGAGMDLPVDADVAEDGSGEDEYHDWKAGSIRE